MTESLKSLQLSIFDIISYILPGFVLILSICLIFSPDGMELIEENTFVVLIFSYLLGNLVHSVAILPDKWLWKFYHRYKEKDKDGHGVERPQKLLGKIVKFLRYNLIADEGKGNLGSAAKTQIMKTVNGHKLDDMDLYQLKETFFISTPSVAGYYEYLNYQKVFSASLGKVFLILVILIPLKAIIGDLSLNFGNGRILDFPYISVALTLCCAAVSIIFLRRYQFFRRYRNSIMNSNIILNFNKKQND